MYRRALLGLLMIFLAGNVMAQQPGLQVSGTTGSFVLFNASLVAGIVVDSNDAKVVRIAADCLSADVALISGKRLPVRFSLPSSGYSIIAGTIGQSDLIDDYIRNARLDVSAIKNKWECFVLSVQGNKLLIAGSDRRGTAYGIMELSRRLGVSPWVYWADAAPMPRQQVYISGSYVSTEPSVQYRGIFINDEDWGLFPWAKRTVDTGVKNIGPETYAKVFELMLRLRANYLWPAMHDSTRAFYYYKESPKLANDYAIAIGGSHCEPMLRNNVCEWEQTFEEEYGRKPGEWRYDVNMDEIYRYWNDRIKEAASYESVVTIGMRGVHDGGMPGPKDPNEKLKLLEHIIADQREILSANFGRPAATLPQIFVPYKEVLALYRRGMKLPEDITIIWPDENFGYLRQLSTPAEQERSGGSGVYYHLSYLGGPHDYTWLASTSPALISYEMTKAYQFGAKKLWVVNVGDIKPAEMETQFFLDLAWNINAWPPDRAHQYATHWATEHFGPALATGIASVKSEYYRLAQEGKPEFMRMLNFLPAARTERLQAYSALITQTDALKSRVPVAMQDAYFELIEYPLKGAALLNQKIIYAQMSFENPDSGMVYSLKAKQAFAEIQQLTQYYNTGIKNGKWNGMMSYMPRNLSVFGMPQVAVPEVVGDSLKIPVVYDRRYLDRTIDSFGVETGRPSMRRILAGSYQRKQDLPGEEIRTFTGLGAGGQSISRYPFTGTSFKQEEWMHAPFAEYEIRLPAGKYELFLKCLPTHAIHKGRGLHIAVSINGSNATLLNIDNSQEDMRWKEAVLRGYTGFGLPYETDKNETATLRVYLLDTGLALSTIEVNPSDR